METQFNCVTPFDLDLTVERFSLFQPRLTTLAYRKLFECFKAGLRSFPEFNVCDDDEQDLDEDCSSDDASNSEQNDLTHDESESEQHDSVDEESEREEPDWSDEESEPRKPYHESEKASEFIRYARSLVNTIPGPFGEKLRLKLFADFEPIFFHNHKAVVFNTSVLLSIFGHENLTSLSINIDGSCLFLPEYRTFETMASVLPNLRELSINVEGVSNRNDCEQAYYWKHLNKLTSLESLTIKGRKLPSNLNIELKLKELKFLRIKKKKFSSYKICAFLLRPEFKHVAEVLASWSATKDDPCSISSSAVLELLRCAGRKACLQPLCQSLTTFSVEKTVNATFWQPASAAFVLLACPNLTNLRTNDTFPFYQALRLLEMSKVKLPKTFKLTQLYVIPEHKENLPSMIKKTSHCQELVIQGARGNKGIDCSYNPELWLNRFMEALSKCGKNASDLKVMYRYPHDMSADQLQALSTVREMRWDVSCTSLGGRESIEWARHRRPIVKGPILKNLKKITLVEYSSYCSEEDLIKECTNVEELYFEGINFCHSGKDLVKFASRHWKQLQVLHINSVREVKWDPDDMIELVKSCPKLRILVLPHSVLRTFQNEPFAKLLAFADERSTQIRFAAPDDCQVYVEIDDDDFDDDDDYDY